MERSKARDDEAKRAFVTHDLTVTNRKQQDRRLFLTAQPKKSFSRRDERENDDVATDSWFQKVDLIVNMQHTICLSSSVFYEE